MALAGSLERWSRLADQAADGPLSAIAGVYLSADHRDRPAEGCLLAALASDASRQPSTVRHALTEGLRPLVDLLARLIPARTEARRREKALATLSGLVGALALARAVDDPALPDEILEAAAASLPSA